MNKVEDYYHGGRTNMVEFLPDSYQKVLEIGCAKGGFRKYLTKENEYWGIEPVEEIAKLAEMTVSEARRVLKISKHPFSLDRPIGESEDSPIPLLLIFD